MSVASDFVSGVSAPAAAPAGAGTETAHFRIVPARYPARIFGTVFSVIIIAAVLNSIVGNPRWGWPVFAEWFVSEPVLTGLGRTILLTALGAFFGFALGGVLALARVSRSPLLVALSWTYIWIFRSIPLIVLLLILNNLGYLYEKIWLGIPYTDITFFSYSTTQLISPFTAAVLGLTLNQGAFAAEIIRGGILSVDQGQHEAAAALGLPKGRQTFRIILPQAMRSILPGAFNDIIGLAKGTSNVYILALPELFYTVQVIFHRNLEVIPLLMVATIWYLIILTVLSAIQAQIERHFARGALRTPPKSLLSRLWSRTPPPSGVVAGSDRPGAATANAGQVATWSGGDRRGAAVSIHGVSKSYGQLKVLDDVTLDIAAGSVTVILGQSGSGKSTLLRTINHLERVDEGFISIDGHFIGYRRNGATLYELKERDVLASRVDVGMVFQSFNLFPHLTVLQNLIEAPLSHGVAKAEAVSLARDLLARIGLSDKAAAYPRQLSGGQQQRIAIARALALKPKVLLFDEPTSALDPELVGEVLDVIRELARSGTTLIVVTHEIGFAREVADRVVFMEAGRIVEVGPPDKIFGHADQARVREFLAKVL
ncbi:amino acid ABC transporter permease/ATP-binding protein [Chelatococcus asaccharovorans]|uniref:Amino acid ABC transporter membrane protein (PAAT family) /amino acid ABC transporter ATP-binding protein (PAAT family) n=1 Tax=Chelatococcus asaccharovorans TaxID=28210 RepID=A0A2V3U5A1_9HYPH|nr:amino acid ABC transporter permease/ATP-binding protein [Chelatococcus asaccharovorans]MBS7703783.1 amino acid ABC transporter permease/ATP-binding protein [Chelatococcus asaccharovorans]PXW57943.1 amino acid ABC transporter membrane protein (PAAT family) /amino acid ABC transporter ATP-binding protein (PAAT family) [Chelatococcus asaccharovorans]